MQISHINMIPALLTKDIEFVAVETGVVKAFHDQRVLDFHELPSFAYESIRLTMRNPEASIEEMQLFVFERWGGLDCTPDIAHCGKPGNPEYVPGHSPAYYDNGEKISDAQLRVLKLIHLDDKTIADQLFISVHTVARHCQDLYNNSGIKSRTQLALWAKNKGIN